MYLQYGDYKHDAGEVELQVDRSPIMADDGVPYAHVHTWRLNGQLVGDDVDDLDAKVKALDAAYTYGGKDVTLYKSNGAPTHLSIANSDAVSGVIVSRPPAFPDMSRAAYVTFLPYVIELQAEIPFNPKMNTILSFSESVAYSGGGSQIVVLEPLETPAVFQRGRRFSAWRAVQSGSAVGYLSQPFYPGPIWPWAQLRRPEVSETTPKKRGNGWSGYAVTWKYEFAARVPLIGNPHVLGRNY